MFVVAELTTKDDYSQKRLISVATAQLYILGLIYFGFMGAALTGSILLQPMPILVKFRATRTSAWGLVICWLANKSYTGNITNVCDCGQHQVKQL
jgi:hypothetical protein